MAKAQEYVIGILFSRENRTEVEFVTDKISVKPLVSTMGI